MSNFQYHKGHLLEVKCSGFEGKVSGNRISSFELREVSVPVQEWKGGHEVNTNLRYDRQKQTVAAGELIFGSPEVIVMAGPCAVEGRESYLACARALMGVANNDY
jgi:3-deoxy-D-arabino-heptulosonate 7-phosphate (DAHP) synthase